MRAGPPKALELLVSFFIPPARREDILGDLNERYRSPLQYLGRALAIVPFVILSQIMRTTDWQVLIMEATLLYASFLAAAWYTGSALLSSNWGLVRLGIPALIVVAVMMLDDAWVPPGNRSQLRSVRSVAIGVGLACLCQAATLPLLMNLLGTSASLLLVSSVRILFAPGSNLPQGADVRGPWPNQMSRVVERSSKARRTLEIATTILIVAVMAASVWYLPHRKRQIGVFDVLTVAIYLIIRKNSGAR